MFKGLGNIASLMKQAQQVGARMQEMSDQLKGQKATGAAGGGMVEADANGLGEILAVRIDGKLVEQQDRELIEDLVMVAVNQALAKARQLHTEALQSLTGGFQLPGLDEAMSKLPDGPGE